MWRIPFLHTDPALGYASDLNKIFSKLTGEWIYDPKQGLQCEVPHDLADPYCSALNEMAGQPVATQKEAHDIAVSRSFAMDLGIITLDPHMLSESKLLDKLRAPDGNKRFHEIYKEWSSRITGGMRAAQFRFHSAR